MTNDRELLELAAKAAGIEVIYDAIGKPHRKFEAGFTLPWNPLTNYGDALRLAVKANIDTSHNPGRCGEVEVYYLLPEEGWVEGRIYSLTEPYNDDPYAATRRAIVRAAAEIGKGMK